MVLLLTKSTKAGAFTADDEYVDELLEQARENYGDLVPVGRVDILAAASIRGFLAVRAC